MGIAAEMLFFIAVLLCFSAIFSSGETAITTCSRAKLLALRDKHSSFERVINWLLKDRQKVLTTILIANNLVNIAASSVATTFAVLMLKERAVLLAVVIMTILIVIFGEILPKTLAMVRSEKVLFITLPIIRFTSIVFYPFVWGIGSVISFLGKYLNIDLSLQSSFVTREEIEQVVNIGEASGVLEEAERKMIHGIISFEDTRVSEVMVPRTDMNVVDSEMTISEMIPFIQEHGHSRVPICEGNMDNVIGILYIKDLITYLHSGETEEKVSTLKRDALFVPETMKVPDLFNIMKSQRIHMAVVVDEYGGTAGLLTLEDLLEEIVGEIQDEYDHELPSIEKIDDNTYKVQGSIDLEDLSDALEYPFESEDVETLGGLVTDLSGNFPSCGTLLVYGSWELTVLKVTDHRVVEVELKRSEEKTDREEN